MPMQTRSEHPARPPRDIREFDIRDPPGRIEATRLQSHSVHYLPYPYPLHAPVISSTPFPDEHWIQTSHHVLIFTHHVPRPDGVGLYAKKLEHFQFYFWTALDRARRSNKPLDGSVRLWERFDLRGMLTWWRICLQVPIPTRFDTGNDGLWRDLLMSSPWFDCPIFWDLLWEYAKNNTGLPGGNDNAGLVPMPRDPRSSMLEEEFFERWWVLASGLPLRRFENGDAVLPITAMYYQAQYGAASMQWRIPGVTEPGASRRAE
ncbi:hypothetical protein ACHAPT_007405 [Fusarium lateritium]